MKTTKEMLAYLELKFNHKYNRGYSFDEWVWSSDGLPVYTITRQRAITVPESFKNAPDVFRLKFVDYVDTELDGQAEIGFAVFGDALAEICRIVELNQ